MGEQCMNINMTLAENGYEVPVFGIGHSCFSVIHVTAIVCLILSLISAITTLVLLFKTARLSLMKWHKHERFLVYRCTCDVIFCSVHMLDHTQILISQDHVRPNALCKLYGLVIVSICLSGASLSLMSAINAFITIYFRRRINFGKRDWKLLIVVFIGPFTIGIIMLILDVLGPSGFFCVFDSVKGVIANVIISTGSLSAILVALFVLYILTWRQIYVEARNLHGQSIDSKHARSATIKSSKAMCLFVAVYIIQWSSACVYGAWQLISEVPFGVFLSVVLLTNVGGVLSGFIYFSNTKNKNAVSDDTDNLRRHTIYSEQTNTIKAGTSQTTM